MSKVSESDIGIKWIAQFDPDDQHLASALVDAFDLVSYQQFFERLRLRILERAETIDGPIGVYCEREIRKWKGKPNRLFTERRTRKRMRAYGPGPRPVEPTRTLNPEVGSEGLVASIVTGLVRQRPDKFVSHPGPDEMRNLKIRAFYLITDFIGSGARATSYLTSAWRIASVKSWSSRGQIRFEVIAYSGTDSGTSVVRQHRCNPQVSIVSSCPTIGSSFRVRVADQIRDLCIRYDPGRSSDGGALGYGGGEALIAFGHGCPNNTPRLLRKRRNGLEWDPLFPDGSTADVQKLFQSEAGGKLDSLKTRLGKLGETRLAKSLEKVTPEGRKMAVLLAAVRRGPRYDETLARRTGLTVPEVSILAKRAIELGWLDDHRRLSDSGHRELAHLRGRGVTSSSEKAVDAAARELYYPQALRAPRSI